MLRARVLTALLLVAGFLAILFLLPNIWASVVFALLAVMAVREWANLVKANDRERELALGLLLAGCLLLWEYSAHLFWVWLAGSIFWLCLAPFWLRFRWRVQGMRLSCLALGLFLILSAWSALSWLHAHDPLLLLAAAALVWVADSGAYFFGRAFGRRKLAPAISPGKTWEGVWGGMAGALLYGLLVFGLAFKELGENWPVLTILLAMLVALSILGDLFESMLKRQAEMKDSGRLLPGHGGVLDRIDGLLPTLPLVALTLYWLER